MELGWGWVFCRNRVKWPSFLFEYRFFFTYSIFYRPNQHIFRSPVTLPQPGLGRIAEQVQVLVA